MLAQTNATADMDDGLPSYLMDIEGARLIALFKETDTGATRVSVRTAHPYDAAAVAAQFGGGGHVRAAGFARPLPLDAAKAEVLPVLARALTEADRRPPISSGG
jgi:phosphoesterase RecJ-like protein